MIKFLLGFISVIVVAFIFQLLYALVISKSKNIVRGQKFRWRKFLSGFSLFNVSLWAKSFHILWRHIVIFAFIFSAIYGYAYFTGLRNRPVTTTLKNVYVPVKDGFVYFDKWGRVYLTNKDKKILKMFKNKEIEGLEKQLKPYGLQFKPIGVLGYGISGKENKFEGGAGISFLKWFRWRLETFLTNKGIYLGGSYKITSNSSLGLGAGKSYDSDNRVIMYYRWNF